VSKKKELTVFTVLRPEFALAFLDFDQPVARTL
jgi:hypothetical protein